MEVITHRGTIIADGNVVEITAGTTRILIISGRYLPPSDRALPTGTFECDGLTKGKSKYNAVFVTHIHADMRGIIGRINADIPIYMSKLAKDMLSIVADFSDTPLPRVDRYLEHGQGFKVGFF